MALNGMELGDKTVAELIDLTLTLWLEESPAKPSEKRLRSRRYNLNYMAKYFGPRPVGYITSSLLIEFGEKYIDKYKPENKKQLTQAKSNIGNYLGGMTRLFRAAHCAEAFNPAKHALTHFYSPHYHFHDAFGATTKSYKPRRKAIPKTAKYFYVHQLPPDYYTVTVTENGFNIFLHKDAGVNPNNLCHPM